MTDLVAWPNGRDLPRLGLLRLPAPRRLGDPLVRAGGGAVLLPGQRPGVAERARHRRTGASGPKLAFAHKKSGRAAATPNPA
jgi:hypothetical protein